MLGIVIVTYKSYDRIKEYVEKDLLPCTMPRKIVVVDVGSERDSAERIAALLGVKVSEFDEAPTGDVIVLHVQENLGYARGNNYGARYLLKHFPETEQLLFSNDDVRFIKGPVLETLVERLRELPYIGAIGPDVVDLRENHQGPLYKHPTVWQTIGGNICEPLLGRRRSDRIFKPMPAERKAGKVAICSGCFLMVSAADFVRVGMFDERTFLFWEEEILSKRLEAIGKHFYYEESVQIQHLVGASMKQNKGPNMIQLKNMLAGGNLYFRYYDRCSWPAYLLLRLSNGMRLFLVYLALLKYRVKTFLGLNK